MNAEVFIYLLPEIIVVATATLIYMGGTFTRNRDIWSWIAVGGLLVAAGALVGSEYPARLIGPLAADGLSTLIRGLVLVVGILLVLLTARAAAAGQAPEYVGTLLLALAGLMLVTSAEDLVLLFAGLELISIPTYVLLYLGRRDRDGQESAIKYFFLSILASAILLYGFSFLYGASGSTRLVDVYRALTVDPPSNAAFASLATLAVVLVFAGLGFKIAAVPFHFYAPDVYEGTTHGNAAVLAVLPKVAGFVALIRIVAVALPGLETVAWQLSLVLAAVTMTLGNVLALWQDNLRRLFAYSSIAHGGYMFIGMAAAFAASGESRFMPHFDGIAAVLFYLTVYVVATVGAFGALAYLGRVDRQLDSVDDLAGLGRTRPIAGLALSVFMFSLAGIPPLAGFWGKFMLFASALGVHTGPGEREIQTWLVVLAVVGVLNAAIAAAYYLRIVASMYFRAPRANLPAEGGMGPATVMVVCSTMMIGIGLYPSPLFELSNRAGTSAVETFASESADQAASQTVESGHGSTETRNGGLTRRSIERQRHRANFVAQPIWPYENLVMLADGTTAIEP